MKLFVAPASYYYMEIILVNSEVGVTLVPIVLHHQLIVLQTYIYCHV
jgi:hypothetical protein